MLIFNYNILDIYIFYFVAQLVEYTYVIGCFVAPLVACTSVTGYFVVYYNIVNYN